jgi:hypothetical protein
MAILTPRPRYTVALAGPELDNKIIEDQLCGREWHGTGVGFGMRGSNRPDLTIRLEGENGSFCFFNLNSGHCIERA